MRVPVLREIGFRQVCAIARVCLLAAPQMSDAEWKAVVLETCAKQQWTSPDADMLARALSAVERSVQETVGPRLVRPVVLPAKPEMPQPRPENVWTKADLTALAETIKRVQARSAGAAPSNVQTVAREQWAISEPAALDEFYRQSEFDRMGALKRFAEIAIARPETWDYAAEREYAERPIKGIARPADCFGCRRHVQLVSHHVIQLQHGGSNYVRNRVFICEPCHSDIHPWLPKMERVAPDGWHRLSGSVALTRVLLDRRKADTA